MSRPEDTDLTGKLVRILRCDNQTHADGNIDCICPLIGSKARIGVRLGGRGFPVYSLEGSYRRVLPSEVVIVDEPKADALTVERVDAWKTPDGNTYPTKKQAEAHVADDALRAMVRKDGVGGEGWDWSLVAVWMMQHARKLAPVLSAIAAMQAEDENRDEP